MRSTTPKGRGFVLELERTHLCVVGCYARPEALDALRLSPLQIRVAPDELLLVSAAGERAALTELAAERLAAVDDGGLAFDVSGGYAAWTLRGADRLELFARLCAIPALAPPGQAQGLFAHVPAKIVFGEDALTVLVSSALAHHVRERILEAAIGLDVQEEAASPLALSLGRQGS